ncbi:hypothetical protein RMR10_023820 (plasmid) [Agrobacterium rosae]|uniref:hypothetical protein n=1 Tax=Agrobacterium rosae TaxID=1972867 RepID=UPI002A0E2E72|nr:hypothetical protein [Agrobacterium rosae]MDX8317182.1 hypothetical protein [Agrobacterium rosae]
MADAILMANSTLLLPLFLPAMHVPSASIPTQPLARTRRQQKLPRQSLMFLNHTIKRQRINCRLKAVIEGAFLIGWLCAALVYGNALIQQDQKYSI